MAILNRNIYIALGVMAVAFAACRAADPVVLDTLKQVCANPNGGHLNEQLIRANYDQLIELFEGNSELVALMEGGRASFNEQLSALKKKSPTQVLKTNTDTLCGVIEIMNELVVAQA